MSSYSIFLYSDYPPAEIDAKLGLAIQWFACVASYNLFFFYFTINLYYSTTYKNVKLLRCFSHFLFPKIPLQNKGITEPPQLKIALPFSSSSVLHRFSGFHMAACTPSPKKKQHTSPAPPNRSNEYGFPTNASRITSIDAPLRDQSKKKNYPKKRDQSKLLRPPLPIAQNRFMLLPFLFCWCYRNLLLPFHTVSNP